MKSTGLLRAVVLYLLTSWFRIAMLLACALALSNAPGPIPVVRIAAFLIAAVFINTSTKMLRRHFLQQEPQRVAQDGEDKTL